MTKLLHASIPADDPAKVAAVLAELMGGEALPFPPAGPDGWMAWADDGTNEIEVVARHSLLHRGPIEAEWRPTSADTRLNEVHLAISVAIPAKQVLEVATDAGWPARLCSRGNGLFGLVEIWIEDAFLIEVFDPDQTAQFLATVSRESWRAMLQHAPHH